MGTDPSCVALALKAWKTQIDLTDTLFGALSSEEVLREIAPERRQRHAVVSEEDFARDPSRNRFAVLLSRTNHLSSHLGQAVP